MDRTVTTLWGSSQARLDAGDIAHIARVMTASLRGDLAGPILPPAYWRKRVTRLLDTDRLTHAQECVLHDLLLQLDQFEAQPQSSWDMLVPVCAKGFAPRAASAASRPV